MTYQLQNDYVSYWNTSLTQIEEEQLTEDITIIQGQIVVIQGQIVTLQGEVDNLQSQVTTLQGQVATLQSDVATLQSQVTTLQGQVATLQSQVTTLQGQVATLQSDVATLQSDVSTIQSQIITILSDISSIEAELLALHTYFYSISIECENLKVNQSLTVKTADTEGYTVNINGTTQFGSPSGNYSDGFDYYFGGIVFASETAFYAMDKNLGGNKYAIGYYQKGESGWVRLREIVSSQTTGFLNYGGLNSKIALGGNGKYLVVSDPFATVSGTSFAGRVHVFYSTSSASTPFSTYTETIITAPTPLYDEGFGHRICMSRDAFVIGISAQYGVQGKLYVARATTQGGTFTVSEITSYTPSTTDRFGNAVDINYNGTVLIATSSFVNKVHVFSYSTTWSLFRTINTVSSPSSVSLKQNTDLSGSGQSLAVGLYTYSSSGYTNNGAVQVYDIYEGTTLGALITASTKINNDWFGNTVQFSKDTSLNANFLLITNFNSSTQTTSGSKAYVFNKLTANWSQVSVYSTYNVREASWYFNSIALPNYNTSTPTTNKFYINYTWTDRITAFVKGSLSSTQTLFAQTVNASSRVYGVHYEDIIGTPSLPYGVRIASYVYTGVTQTINLADYIVNTQSTRMRIRAWGGGGGGGSGSQQNAGGTGGTTQTLTGGSGGGSGAYFDMEISLTAIYRLDILVGKGGSGGAGVTAPTSGNYIAGQNGGDGQNTVLTFYGAYDPDTGLYAWTTSISVLGGQNGLAGTTNVARAGGAGGATSTSLFTVSEEFPARRAVAGTAGGAITDYNTIGAGVTGAGNYGSTGGGSGGGVNASGLVFANGSRSGAVLWATAGMTEILTTAQRSALGGDDSAVSGVDGRDGIDEGGVWSRGGSGGGGGSGGLITDISAGYGGNGGFPAGGGGGGGASKNSQSSGFGGNGGDGFVLISVY